MAYLKQTALNVLTFACHPSDAVIFFALPPTARDARRESRRQSGAEDVFLLTKLIALSEINIYEISEALDAV
jgi:hypothetical protein